MPAQHIIDEDNGIIITNWTGAATDDALLDTIQKYNKDIRSKPEYRDFNEIVDFTMADNINLTYTGLMNVAEAATDMDAVTGKTKLAIIVDSNLAFSLARMYITYRSFFKSTKKSINVFKFREAAMDWFAK